MTSLPLSLRNNYTFLLLACLGLFLASCSPQNTLRGVFKKQTPYERYADGLKQAKLDQTALGQQWLGAGQKALQKPVAVTLPFRESGYFPAEKPIATAYQFSVKRGQKVSVKVQAQGQAEAQIFLDLYETDPDKPLDPKHVANADSTARQFEYEIEEDLPHILRVQPELLRSSQYTVIIETLPTLAFPVQGKDSRAVQSFWGMERDAGARRHEGIDIFAPRGTPAVASTEGVVTRVEVTRLGGKVVWLSDAKRRQNIYYAHLDTQLVEPGTRVSIGDTLGLVGNTGNAITTPPHLHYGVYRFGEGAVDPYPFVHQDRTQPAKVQVDTRQFGAWTRVSKTEVNLRAAPSTSASAVAALSKHVPVQVLGGSGSWYRVMLPNGQEGYLAAHLVEPLDKPVQSAKVKQTAPLLDASSAQAAIKQTISPDTSVRVLAKYHDYLLVKSPDGNTGWISSGAIN